MKKSELVQIIKEELQSVLKELDYATYQSAAQKGIDRGDSRGQKIASQAGELITRKFFKGKPLRFKTLINSSKTPVEFSVINVSEKNDTMVLYGQAKSNEGWEKTTFHSQADIKIKDMYLYLNNEYIKARIGRTNDAPVDIEVDRESANRLSAAYNEMYKDVSKSIKPNQIKQF